MSPVTHTLLAANILIFFLLGVFGQSFFLAFALWPIGAGFAPWQVLTSAFLHGSVMHLATNMFGLWMFGRDVEARVGSERFAVLYFISVLTASAAQVTVTHLTGGQYPTVGASGGLFGVLAAFAMLFPKRMIILLFPPIPLPAPIFVALYAAFELYAGVTGTLAGVAHFAHLGGLVGGIWVVFQWRRRALRR